MAAKKKTKRRGRPPGSKNKPKTGLVTHLIRVARPLDEAVRKLAAQRGMSVNAVFNAAAALAVMNAR